MAIETVTSPLLSDPPLAPAEKAVRPVGEDYAKSVDAGYVESLEAFGARMDLRRIALLDLAACLFFAALALTGRHYLRETR